MTDWTKEINQQSLDQNLLGEKILTNAVYVTPEELKLIRYVEYQSDILVKSQSLLNKEEKVKSKTQCNRQMWQKELKSIANKLNAFRLYCCIGYIILHQPWTEKI